MSAVEAPEQQLTRRQIRELRNAAAGEDLAAPETVRIVTPTPKSALVDTEVLPAATRRTMREVEEVRARSSATNAPRAAVLSVLGIATIAAPLTGFVTPEQSAHAIGPVIQTSTPLAQSLSALAAETVLESATSYEAALAANPNAAVLALDLSARDQARTATACTPIEGASGLREASTDRIAAIHQPMVAGTYQQTSTFGPRWGSFHNGLDMAAPIGTPIYAVTDGEVVLHAPNGQEGRSGNLVVIHSVIDDQDVWFWYGHMYDNGVYVTEGETVSAGQLIGGIGNKGFSTGPHLHFEVHVGQWGNVVDPAVWLYNAGATSPGSC